MSSLVFDPKRPLNSGGSTKRNYRSYEYLPRLTIEELFDLQSGAKLLVVNNFHDSSRIIEIHSLSCITTKWAGTTHETKVFEMGEKGPLHFHSATYTHKWFALKIV